MEMKTKMRSGKTYPHRAPRLGLATTLVSWHGGKTGGPDKSGMGVFRDNNTRKAGESEGEMKKWIIDNKRIHGFSWNEGGRYVNTAVFWTCKDYRFFFYLYLFGVRFIVQIPAKRGKVRGEMKSDDEILLPVKIYRAKNGQPTCAKNFATNEVCRFLGEDMTGRFSCGALHTGLYRRQQGAGTVEPDAQCPIWKEKKENE